MTKGKIKVITDVPPNRRQKGKKYEPTILEIDADVYGDLGIHRPFHLDEGKIIYAKHGWQVTENNSGQRQVTWGTKAECVAYCKEFNRIAATTGVGGEWVHSPVLGRGYWKVNEAYRQAHNEAFRIVKATQKVTK
jgi:hypothetical protein